MAKERIDVLLAKRGLAPSREKARVLVMAGEIFSGTERITRPDKRLDIDAPLEVRGNPIPYVGFGGVKLAHAVKTFGIDVQGKRALDVGSSTGGFVDFLLQNGASEVFAIDAGTHQLHEKLRADKRVILRENMNARYLIPNDVGNTFQVITIDVSFISVRKILPVVVPVLGPEGVIISLIKPQFEVGRFSVGKGGIVKDQDMIAHILEEIKAYGLSLGLNPVNMVEAPRDRERKNREYFILWEHQKEEDRTRSSFLPA